MIKNKKVIIIPLTIILLFIFIYVFFIQQPSFWWYMGNICEQRHQSKRAISYFKRATKINPEYAEGYFYVLFKGEGKNLLMYTGGLAVCYETIGDKNKAKEYYNKALEIYTKDSEKIPVTALIRAKLKTFD